MLERDPEWLMKSTGGGIPVDGRFEKFNDMPHLNSKYKRVAMPRKFNKQISRQAPIMALQKEKYEVNDLLYNARHD